MSDIALAIEDNGIAITVSGAPGPTGPAGPPGTSGVPNGGTTGQVLEKASNADQDTRWADQASSIDYRKLQFLIESGPIEIWPHSYKTVVGGAFPTAITWWTDNTQTVKIIEKLIVRNANQLPTSITYRVYSSDGLTVVKQLVDVPTYSGVFETALSRTVT